MDTFLVHYYQAIIDVSIYVGVKPTELPKFTKISGRLNTEVLKESIEYLIRKSGERNIPLLIGKQFRSQTPYTLLYAMSYAKDMAEALQILMKYSQLVHTGISIEIKTTPVLTITLLYSNPSVQHIRYPAEGFMSIYLTIMRNFTGQHIEATHVEFFHQADSDSKPLDDFFGTKVEFGASQTRMEFDSSILEFPLLTSDSINKKIYIRHIAIEYDKLDSNAFLERVKVYLRSNLFPTPPSIKECALAFNISVRTLQYRLSNKDLKYNNLLNNLRHDEALIMIKEQLPLGMISMLVGFQNHSAFTRSFKKREGISPHEARKNSINKNKLSF